MSTAAAKCNVFFFFVKQIYILKKYCIIIMYVLCLKMYTVKQRRCYHLYIQYGGLVNAVWV